jgi:hypothetical protein|tara:strand:- start:285 stop:515 length:231 start_codon:yes stop_codon:yes gene_type:complete
MITEFLTLDEAIQLAEAIAVSAELAKQEGLNLPHLDSLSNKFTKLVLQIPLNRSTDEEERSRAIALTIDENQGIEL